MTNPFSTNKTDKMYTPWQPGAFRSARKYRMRLAWSVWVVATIFVLFQFFLQLSSGEIIDGLMKSFALTALGGGVLASSYYYIYVSLQIPAGLLMDRYGPRGILSLGALFVCLGCLLFSAAKTLPFALIGRILMGGGAAFAFVGCLNVIGIWFPKKQFALMTAIVETAGMIGAILGNFWIAIVIHRIGWRNCIFFAGLFSAVLTILLFFIVRNAPTQKRMPSVKKETISLIHGLRILLRKKVVWINGIYLGILFCVVTTFTALWAIPFLEVSRHLTLLNASMIAATLYAGVGIGGPILGWLDARTKWRREILIINAFFAALFLFFVIFDTQLSLLMLSILLFLTGVCSSGYILTFAIANDISTTSNHATCIGFTNMLCVILAPIFQPLIGFLVTWMNHRAGLTANLNQSIPHFQWAISLIPFSLVFATGLAFFLPKK
ncbi:MAG: MFS transporter [Gammaproteobacteria bacterium CG_4_10_14_0_8_um_filter_38_16]|nr:MAG: MFS transporter [Gammaproteobacteria bacterium CG_4_10_14_0_8_um_filter_38_16]PJA02737.1 MAG: MFS transporter [Gammaproteobacteria bacterium CG_4_10_14_0_2_um_filter_38_22]PJB10868.1 MAG: MFS transporter [Gammaproteobacteria bacterium CG_4_9_14_3_um_filter_38_9]